MCGQYMVYQLCRKRTWFTLFFIPIIPYRVVYCLECPNCHAYIEIKMEQFQQMKQLIEDGEEKAYEYAGKTPTQIAYLKGMEKTTSEELDENHE